MARTRALYVPKKRLSAKAKSRRFEQKLQTAVDQASTDLVLSHGHCLDGVGSAIILGRALGSGLGVAYIQPTDVARVLEWLRDVPCNGRRLIIADLSLQPKQFDAIVTACERLKDAGWVIQWYDHHHKQWEGLDLNRLRPHLHELTVNADATESGASLVQQKFATKDRFAKRLAETIRDRDLWWNKTPDSETLEFALEWMGTEEFTAHFMGRSEADDIVDATIMQAARDQKAQNDAHKEELLATKWQVSTKDGDKISFVYGWMPKNVGLHEMLQDDAVAVAVNVRPNGRMSLRSNKEWTVCHRIAGRFGGGGHPNASGGLVGVKGFSARWYVWRRGRTRPVELIQSAAVEEVERFRNEGGL